MKLELAIHERDQLLATVARGCLAGSFVAAVGFVFVIVVAFNPLGWVRIHPIAAIKGLVCCLAFAVSATALSKLIRGGAIASARQLWSASLAANLVFVAIVWAAIGSELGFLVFIPELAGIGLHVVGIAAWRRDRHGI
ncbi:MAG TPA: hypothetical protein VK437_03040 [Steroidobacteraceae bacterium]|nr:hypothetical protein [Steroidobacteraceae bacterium]